jgi:Alcohol dehydrogenase GroES-like domain
MRRAQGVRTAREYGLLARPDGWCRRGATRDCDGVRGLVNRSFTQRAACRHINHINKDFSAPLGLFAYRATETRTGNAGRCCPRCRRKKPTDAIIRLSATCICGSDLWPFRGLNDVKAPMVMGHEYCGIVEEVGSAVKTVRPGQFVVGLDFRLGDLFAPHVPRAV